MYVADAFVYTEVTLTCYGMLIHLFQLAIDIDVIYCS